MKCFLDHIVLNMEDEENMISFYTQVLLLAPERLEEYRNNTVPFPSVRLNERTIIDLFPTRMWQNGPGDEQGRRHLNHICIALSKDDWHQLAERLQANNIAIAEGPVLRWGALGSGTSIYFKDPEGNTVEARYYEERQSSEKCLLSS